MQGMVVGDLRIEALEDEASTSVRLLWQGKSTHRHLGEALAPYFRKVLAAAGTKRLPIELHFQKLEHVTSPTITSILRLIQESRARSIKLIMIYDQACEWQKLSFDAMRMLARDDLLELRAA